MPPLSAAYMELHAETVGHVVRYYIDGRLYALHDKKRKVFVDMWDKKVARITRL